MLSILKKALCVLFAAALLTCPYAASAQADSDKQEEDAILKFMKKEDSSKQYIWPPKYKGNWTDKLPKLSKTRMKSAINTLNTNDFTQLEKVAYDLEIMGEDAMPGLLDILNSNEHSPRAHLNTLYVMGRIGERADSAVPSISKYLYNKDEDFRAISARALGKIGANADRSVAHLRRLLKDESPWVRESARNALMAIGTPNALRAIKEQYDSILNDSSNSG